MAEAKKEKKVFKHFYQSGTKPNLVANILATNFECRFCNICNVLKNISQKINLLGRNKLIVLRMNAKEFTEVPHTIGCKISQGIVC